MTVTIQMLRDHVQARLPQFLDELATLSMIDCGTYNKAGVDEVGAYFHAKLSALGMHVDVEPHPALGDTLIGRWRGSGTKRLLLVGHLDTVYPDGWPQAHPFKIDGDTAHGPGTADMKAGLLAGLYALHALHDSGFDEFAEIAFVLNSDEEIGSPATSGIIEREAQGCDAVLVLECGRENGDIVSARKGIAKFTLQVQGRSAHAGVDPERGRNAILELAHQVIAAQSLNGTVPGAIINVGVISGGMKVNVVPAEAEAQIDIRATDRVGIDAIIAALHACAARTTVPDSLVTLSGGVLRPPMEKTAATARLVELCQQVAHELGFQVNDAATGGASDANFTASLGVPSLDGLGPVGGQDHSPDEYIQISSIVPRTTMLAALILSIAQEPVAAPQTD
jgi:glutamate carboxypeptidase